jgi:hypothetical protein
MRTIIQRTTRKGRELSLKTALTKTLVSRTSSSKQRLDFFLSLLDHPIDIFVAQAGPDHKAARSLSCLGQAIVRRDHSGNHALLRNAKAIRGETGRRRSVDRRVRSTLSRDLGFCGGERRSMAESAPWAGGRTGHGGVVYRRSGRLYSHCLGLPQFPRGQRILASSSGGSRRMTIKGGYGCSGLL